MPHILGMPRWFNTLVGDAGEACTCIACVGGLVAPFAAIKSKKRFSYVATIVKSCFAENHPRLFAALHSGDAPMAPHACRGCRTGVCIVCMRWWPRSASSGDEVQNTFSRSENDPRSLAALHSGHAPMASHACRGCRRGLCMHCMRWWPRSAFRSGEVQNTIFLCSHYSKIVFC